MGKEELKKIPEIDLILGTNEKNDIIKYLEQYLKDRNKKIDIGDVMHQNEFLDFGEITYTENIRAVVKIEDGCDKFCTYCIIPYARGKIRSRLPENTINEIKKIANNGIKEVVLTGIHIASYGKDFKDRKYCLIDLIEDINKIEGIERIRLGSLEPTMFTEEFLNRLTQVEKICDHFHLSMQSGCNDTLKRMNRKYTIKEFQDIVNRIRTYYKEVAITTDIIVGFPGETEEEFNQTYQFVKEIQFYQTHIFRYSKRNGTKAAVMQNQIDEKTKEERSEKLIQLSQKQEKKFLEKHIGKEISVLFEEEENDYIKGHTGNYMMVKIKKQKQNLYNKIEKIRITQIEGLHLIGEL